MGGLASNISLGRNSKGKRNPGELAILRDKKKKKGTTIPTQTKDVKRPICLHSGITNDLKIKSELNKKLKQDTGLRECINRQHRHVGTKSEWPKSKASYHLKGSKGNEKDFINTLKVGGRGGEQVSQQEGKTSTRQVRQRGKEGWYLYGCIFTHNKKWALTGSSTQIKSDNNVSRDAGWNGEQVNEYLVKLDVIKSERPDEIFPAEMEPSLNN